jgi:hypothetical protein
MRFAVRGATEKERRLISERTKAALAVNLAVHPCCRGRGAALVTI